MCLSFTIFFWVGHGSKHGETEPLGFATPDFRASGRKDARAGLKSAYPSTEIWSHVANLLGVV
jgi:hypothetical protein